MFSLWMDYPSAEEESRIVAATTSRDEVVVEEVFTKAEMEAFQSLVRRVPVSQHVIDYAVMIARATRPSADEASPYVKKYVEWGAGPRASQHMILGAKALALLDGRPAVSAEHVRQVAALVLRHRVLANYEATGEGIGAADIVAEVLRAVREPTYER
jgi:MoxR-like ATPase